MGIQPCDSHIMHLPISMLAKTICTSKSKAGFFVSQWV